MRRVTIGSAAPIKAATTQATSTARSVISRRASALVTGRSSSSGCCEGLAFETSCGSTARGVPPFLSRMGAQTTLVSLADEKAAGGLPSSSRQGARTRSGRAGERTVRDLPRCALPLGCKSFYAGVGWRGFRMAKGWQEECGISEEGVEILSWVEALPEEARKELAATIALL